MNPLITVITPLYNREELISQTWKSIKSQTNSNWEWIVVDDGSTDSGPKLIKALSKEDVRVRFFKSEHGNMGPSHARNIGVDCSRGKYLIFLDSDDLIIPSCLKERIDFMENNQNLDFAVFTESTFKNVPGDLNKIFSLRFKDKHDYLKSFLEDSPPWSISGPIWKSTSFKDLGGFKEDYRIMEDPELHIRALINGLNFKIIDSEPDFYYRQQLKTPKEEEQFWKNSIKGREIFFKDTYNYLVDKNLLEQNSGALTQGILSFIKIFYLSRMNLFRTDFKLFLDWGIKKKLIPSEKKYLLKMYSVIKTNKLLDNIPFVKGLIYGSI